MRTLLPSSCCSPARLHLLLSALFFLTLLSPVNHCLNLNGVCRRDTCKLTEGTVATCRRKWKCCCTWWILFLVPTPVIYSDYQAPHKKIGK
ncbi:hypothetical protein AB1E18_018614 [Capra hircus]